MSSGEIAGAALDVLEEEPPRRGTALSKIPNLITSPHVAWSAVESRKRPLKYQENIKSFLRGHSKTGKAKERRWSLLDQRLKIGFKRIVQRGQRSARRGYGLGVWNPIWPRDADFGYKQWAKG